MKPPLKYEYRYYQRNAMQSSIALSQRPFPHQVAGEIQLGFIDKSRTIFCITREELVQHLLLVGRSGAGKTNTLRIIQIMLSQLQIPFLCFDLVKYNSRHLKKRIPNLHIVRWDKEFFFNPLFPPHGVKLKEWMLTFAEVTSEVFGLMAASKSLLIDVLDYLYRANDTENSEIFPTIHDLNRVLDSRRKTTKSRIEIDYIDRIRNKTKAICITLDKMIDVQQGIPIDEILKQQVCIELVGINSSEIQAWIISLIMAWIALYRSHQNNAGELKHVIFYDEASHAFSKSRTNNTETFLVRQFRTLRESGEGVILADQSISSLTDIIKSNVYTVISLSQSSPLDIREISLMMNLSQEQTEQLNKLPQGQGIIKLASRYPNPVLINFPFLEPYYISEEVLDLINTKNEFIDFLKNKIIPVKKPETNTKTKTCKRQIDDNTKNFLMSANLYQFKKSITEITELANLSAGTGSRIAKFCEKQNLIKIIQVTGLRGRPKFPVLTQEAYKILGIEQKTFYGKGAGLEHILYQNLISEHFKKFKPMIEFNRGDKFIDVAIKTNEFLLAIEVAMSPVNEKTNIEKDILNAKADFVIVVCKDKKVLNLVKQSIQELSENLNNKVKLCLVSEILNSNAEEFIEEIFLKLKQHKQGSFF